MIMWIILFLLVIIFSLGAIVFLIRGFHKFSFINKLANKNKRLSWTAAIVPVVLIVVLSAVLLNYWATMIILIHLFIFWAAAAGTGRIIRGKREMKHNIEGAAAIAFTAVYLGIGWYFAHHVYRTSYTFSTKKDLGQEQLRIVGIADLHLGLTLDGDSFAEQCDRISDEKPDIVLVAGDFVDDDSNRDDMIKSCRALGAINTKYGIYFTMGNHDAGYGNGRDFSLDDLTAELKKNHVTVLEDESVLVNDSFYIIGRKDTSDSDRLSMEKLVSGLDKSRYIITADHQPNDYDSEAGLSDLVFSGHTHGGHIFPAGYIGLLIGANDKVYGSEKRDGTDFVVTSGISGWAIPFKTGARSEYVVMDICGD